MSYVDNRDWPEYNAQLVQRGEFYLDLNYVKNWSWGREWLTSWYFMMWKH